MKILTSGESHGDALYGIIDGFPSGFKIDISKINLDLKKRLSSVGRGPRSKREDDEILFLTGVTDENISTGSPITLQILNHMTDLHTEENVPRPGHADLAGAIKYNHRNVRNVLERASARKTAMDVAIGSLCKQVLALVSVRTSSYVKSINGKEFVKENVDKLLDEHPTETFGGTVVTEIDGLPIGIGSFTNDLEKLDGILARRVMSINSVKGVSIGMGFDSEMLKGYDYVDKISFEDGIFTLKSNNSGGIDGGMTNGNRLVINAAVKPIPTQSRNVESVNLNTFKQDFTFKERGDNFALEPISLIVEMIVATELLTVLFKKFDSDNILLFKRSYDNYINYIKEYCNETIK